LHSWANLYYSLYKNYGTIIKFTRMGKGEIDIDTGLRINADQVISLPCVFCPVDFYDSYVTKLLGFIQVSKTSFLFLKSNLPEVNDGDTIEHGNLRYNKLEGKDMIDVILIRGEIAK